MCCHCHYCCGCHAAAGCSGYGEKRFGHYYMESGSRSEREELEEELQMIGKRLKDIEARLSESGS